MKPPFDVMIVHPRQLDPHQWAMVEIGSRYVLLVCRGAISRAVLAEAWEAFVRLHRSRGVEVLFSPGEPVAHLVPFPATDHEGGIAVCGCEPWLGLGSPAEWERAHELPVCEECQEWTNARTGWAVRAFSRRTVLLESA